MKIIAVKFKGGLGNQLFQYSTARALIRKTDILLLDCTTYTQDYLGRKFTLDKFKIEGVKIFNRNILRLFKADSMLNRIVSKLKLFKDVKENGFVFRKFLRGDLNYLTSIEGYWQSEEYFKNIREELLKELTPKEIPALPDFIQDANCIAVHVRRTDYLKDERYGFLGEKYYKDAIEYFRNHLKETVFVFFSDDLNWCRDNFKDPGYIFFSDKDWEQDYLQLYLMSKCKHQIIANSSFSWWGAWLNTSENKIVIRPAKPFKDVALLYEHHYPKEWIVV